MTPADATPAPVRRTEPAPAGPSLAFRAATLPGGDLLAGLVEASGAAAEGVALLIDLSGSLVGRPRARAVAFARALCASLGAARPVAVAAAGDHPALLAAFPPPREVAAPELPPLAELTPRLGGGATCLAAGVELLRAEARRAQVACDLVVVSDLAVGAADALALRPRGQERVVLVRAPSAGPPRSDLEPAATITDDLGPALAAVEAALGPRAPFEVALRRAPRSWLRPAGDGLAGGGPASLARLQVAAGPVLFVTHAPGDEGPLGEATLGAARLALDPAGAAPLDPALLALVQAHLVRP